jgi:hypothetical protein
MESNSNIDWKMKYEAQERMIFDYMTDLANYRILVAQLKAEVNTFRNRLEYSENRAKNLEKGLRATLFEETIYEYYHNFKN